MDMATRRGKVITMEYDDTTTIIIVSDLNNTTKHFSYNVLVKSRAYVVFP